jgi:putative ABC transport system permease protein
MNLFKLSWKNLISKPLNMGLSLLLVALGVGLTSILLLINKQFQDRLYNNVEDIHMVIGAKGSPLQMILSSVYHIDVPTGNIPLKKTKWLKKSKFVSKAIPLALGDSYKGFRIVGTDHQLPEHYKVRLKNGKLWEKDMQACVGAKVAQKLKLKIGSTFHGSHGLVDDGMHVHETYPYKVVGIFAQSNTVLDQLILTNVSSVWRVHEDHDHEAEIVEGTDQNDSTNEDSHNHDGHNHDGHNHDGHNHDEHSHDEHNHDGHNHDGHNHDGHNHDGHNHTAEPEKELAPISEEGKEITAMLVTFAKDQQGNTSTMASVHIPKIIDETEGLEELGYAIPAIQLRRLLDNMGLGAGFLYVLAIIIIGISAFSMFISLYSSMKERKYEVALMRTMGASRLQLFFMVSMEGILIGLFGYLIGMLISHGGMAILAGYLEDTYQYSFSATMFMIEEFYLLIGSLLIGFIAALIPALQAYRTNISSTLGQG